MIATKRLALRASYFVAMLMAATVATLPSMVRADSTSGWVYQNWESVKAGASVDAAGNWYAWGSLYFDGSIVENTDPNLLWVKGQLLRWDGSKAVVCTETGWIHPTISASQRAQYAYTSGTATSSWPVRLNCGTGWYMTRTWAYSRVSTIQGGYEFHGGNLDTAWTWVTQ